ncbi:MAG: delta-60 repeat domain-containing protein, partial [Bacteroidota bacterium]|nr:delta-60 repeat domain-containing protein [Bacteroidota bacterium]
MPKLIVAVFLIIAAPSIFAQQPGDLDSSFAGNGKFSIAGDRSVQEIITLPDGKILLMANNTTSIELMRLNESGTIDTLFAQNGSLIVPGIGLRLFRRFDGKIILVRNAAESGPGYVHCYLPDGDVDLSFGIDGVVTPSAPFGSEPLLEADISVNGQLLICGISAFVLPIDINGQIDTVAIHHIPDLPFICLGGTYVGQTHYVIYRSQSVRFMPDGEIWFLYRRHAQQCSNNYPLHEIFKNRFNINMSPISSELFIPPEVPGNISTLYNMYVPMNAPYRYALQNFIPSNHLLYGPPDTTCIGFEPLTVYVWEFTDDNGINYPYYSSSGKKYGRISIDQAGHYIVPISTGSHFWSYKTQPYCFSPDSSWGYSGFKPPEDEYPIIGAAEAAAVQMDGKVLIGGRLATDGLVVLRYHNIPDPRSTLDLTMILGGAYGPTTSLMRDDLRQAGLLPEMQPYSPEQFQAQNGTGSWGMGAGVMDLIGEEAIVDWVWLELLDTSDQELVVATRVGLLQRNGKVTQADGHSPIDFSAGAGSYYLRVRHRNHLSVTLADPITLGVEPLQVDLTSPATTTFGTDAQMEIDGVMMLWPGDVSGDSIVKYIGAGNDRDPILVAVGGST